MAGPLNKLTVVYFTVRSTYNMKTLQCKKKTNLLKKWRWSKM